MENLVINKKYSKSFWCAKVLHRLPLITGVSSFYNKKRHKIINDKLLPIMDCAVRISPKIDKKVNSKNIWVFWWQGKDRMPSLVEKCYQSVIRNKGRRHVILITKDNIKQYATIPDYIYEKVNNGEITLTHLSDILRFNLLNEYGGLWIDSTIYLTDSLDVFDTEKIHVVDIQKTDFLIYLMADGQVSLLVAHKILNYLILWIISLEYIGNITIN